MWYIAAIKPQSLKKITAHLTRKKIEYYCPLNRIKKNERNKIKVSFEPLFPSFLFVQCNATNMDVVKNISGFINYMHWMGQPVEVTSITIEKMQDFTLQYSNIELAAAAVNEVAGVELTREYKIDTSGTVTISGCKLLLGNLGYTLSAKKETTVLKVLRRDQLRGSFTW